MKNKIVFALLLAGSMFGMANNANAQVVCASTCGVSCSGESCTANADGVVCRTGRAYTIKACPKVVAHP